MSTPSVSDGIEEAVREQIRLRAIIAGATGSGKTATGLVICNALAKRYGGRIGVIDTQHRQSLNYVKTRFAPDGFLVKHLATGNPEAYINAIKMFRTKDVVALLIDSLSDAWQGDGGVLDQAGDNAQFSDWGPAKKGNFGLLREIQRSPCHVVATVLADTHYVIRTDEEGGKSKMKGVDIVGSKPIQDKKAMPKFDLQLGMDQYHNLTVYRTSFPPFDRIVVNKPDEAWFGPYMDWMEQGDVPTDPEEAADVGHVASLEQIEEFYRLCLVHGMDQKTAMVEFYKQNGFKPEESADDFLEQKLVKLRSRKLVVVRDPKAAQPQ